MGGLVTKSIFKTLRRRVVPAARLECSIGRGDWQACISVAIGPTSPLPMGVAAVFMSLLPPSHVSLVPLGLNSRFPAFCSPFALPNIREGHFTSTTLNTHHCVTRQVFLAYFNTAVELRPMRPINGKRVGGSEGGWVHVCGRRRGGGGVSALCKDSAELCVGVLVC